MTLEGLEKKLKIDTLVDAKCSRDKKVRKNDKIEINYKATVVSTGEAEHFPIDDIRLVEIKLHSFMRLIDLQLCLISSLNINKYISRHRSQLYDQLY